MEHELTFGEKAVGLSFNPSGNEAVQQIKESAAAFIDNCNDFRNVTEDGEVKRMYSVGITEAQTAQMWAVKAATWSLPQLATAGPRVTQIPVQDGPAQQDPDTDDAQPDTQSQPAPEVSPVGPTPPAPEGSAGQDLQAQPTA